MRFMTVLAVMMTGMAVSAAVTPGQWGANFTEAKEYAEQNEMPLVLVWGVAGCGHCSNLVNALDTTEGVAWASALRTKTGKSVVFCRGSSANWGHDSNPDKQAAWNFASDSNKLGATPFVCLYWPGIKTERFSGQDLSASSESALSPDGLQQLLAQFEARVDEFMSTVDENASFAAFPMGDTPNDRLEIQTGSTKSYVYLYVPVVRTNGLSKAAECRLTFNYQGSKNFWTSNVVWKANKDVALIRYRLSNQGGNVTAGKKINLELRETDANGGAVLATRHIWIVDPPENSPKNPYWLGEKTASTLAWGDWSMDLDAVTNKVRAFNAKSPAKRAYAMMLVQGSCWCPDCAMAEENVFSKQAFKNWAKDRQVVFGVVDIPNYSKDLPQSAVEFPSLLRYDTYDTMSSPSPYAYMSLRDSVATNELQRYQSGAGYLSRHDIYYSKGGRKGTNAVEIASRNAFLVGHDTLNGGWNRPERDNKNRTGVPMLLLLRDDGTIAARWNHFSDVGPKAFHEGYLQRFDEMLAQVDEEAEESDDDQSTTRRLISDATGSVADTLSAVDQKDVYEIGGVEENKVVRYRIAGEMASGRPAQLTVAVINGETGAAIATVTGDVSSVGFSLSAKLGPAKSYYLRVAPSKVADGEPFGYTNEESTVCSYVVTPNAAMSGGELGFSVLTTNVWDSCGEVALPVCRQNGSEGSASVNIKLVSPAAEELKGIVEWTDATLNWAADEEGDCKSPAVVRIVGSVSKTLTLTFALAEAVGEAEDVKIAAGAGTMTVNVYATDVTGSKVFQFVRSDLPPKPIIGYQPGDEVVIEFKGGPLPDGLSVTAVNGELCVVGCSSAEAGEYRFVHEVRLMRGGVEVVRQELSNSVTVVTYDFAGIHESLSGERTYGNLPVDAEDLVQGMLTVSVPPNGKLSAKFVTAGKAFAYAADGWDRLDELQGVLTAVLNPVSGAYPSMTVTFDSKGGTATFDDPLAPGEKRTIGLTAGLLPGDSIAAWKGQYTVQMPQVGIDGAKDRLTGSGYMAMRMTDGDAANGQMLYAGMLPNGRAVYGVSALMTGCRTAGGEISMVQMPFYHASDLKTAPYAFSGCFAITNVTLRQCVFAACPVVWTVPGADGQDAAFDVFGAYYDSETVSERYRDEVGSLDNLVFTADTGKIVSELYGSAESSIQVQARMTETNMPELAVSPQDNPQHARLSFSKETGVISGSFVIPFVGEDLTVAFRGIALPGWQNCGTCHGDVERPWAVGSCSFTDFGTGFFRNGCEIKMGKAE